ncbi:MAG: hypothetical protein DRH57_07915, partial [Candidatus Cloacimonadota bacterium]
VYSFELAPNVYDIRAELEGYHTELVENVEVTQGDTTTVDIIMTPVYLGGIQGVVDLQGGAGNVQDVEITAGDQAVHPDPTGHYLINIMPGTYDVKASLVGYKDSTIVGVIVYENQITSDIDFTLYPYQPGYIEGTIALIDTIHKYKHKGNVQNVVFTIEDTSGNSVEPDSVYGPQSDGYYKITISSGTYNITALLDGYQDSTITCVEVAEGDTTSGVDFTLYAFPGSIEGIVTLSDGHGPGHGPGNVQNVEVTAGGIMVHPDSTGHYEIVIGPGTYDVTATYDSLYYYPQTIENVVVIEGQATTGIDFNLQWMGAIQGTVTLETGGTGNVQDVEINIYDDGNIIATTNPGVDNTYIIYLVPGIYDSVTASLDGYHDSTVVDVNIQAGTITIVDFELQLIKPGHIEGFVTLAGYGTGNVQEVEFTVIDTADNPVIPDSLYGPDSTGYYEIYLYEGTYDVTAELVDYYPQTITDIEVIELQYTNVNFTLTPMEGAIEGHITLIKGTSSSQSVVITAVGDSTGYTSTAQPDSVNNYAIPLLPPDFYDVSAELFAYFPVPDTQNVQVIQNDTTRGVNFTLYSYIDFYDFTTIPGFTYNNILWTDNHPDFKINIDLLNDSTLTYDELTITDTMLTIWIDGIIAYNQVPNNPDNRVEIDYINNTTHKVSIVLRDSLDEFTQGDHTFQIKVDWNEKDVWMLSDIYHFSVDITPPQIISNNAWITSETEFRAEVLDNESQVDPTSLMLKLYSPCDTITDTLIYLAPSITYSNNIASVMVSIDIINQLLAGDYNFIYAQWSADNNVELHSEATYPYVLDISPPVVEFTSPTVNNIPYGDDVLIAGNYYDLVDSISVASGIDVSATKLYVDGEDITENAIIDSNNFTYTQLSPNVGPHTATIVVYDNAGNVAQDIISYFIGDGIPIISNVKIEAGNVSENYFNPSYPITYKATISPNNNVPIQQESINLNIYKRVLVQGMEIDTLLIANASINITGTDTFSIEKDSIMFNFEQNDIGLRFELSAKNIYNVETTDNYLAYADFTSPVITIVSPEDNAIFQMSSTVNISANYTDNIMTKAKKKGTGCGVDTSKVSLQLIDPFGNFIPVDNPEITSTNINWTTDPLTEAGEYTIKLTVGDNVGNIAIE